MKFYFFTILFIISSAIFSQNNEIIKTKNGRKGKLYFYWGWNGSSYSNSDISFKGDNYDFTLNNVQAQDRQSKFSFSKYFSPTSITIPQYNFRVGYYFKDNWDISFGIDHMKYVVEQGSTAQISGSISNSGTEFDGEYNNDDIIIQEGLLEFEHTDGLNYVNFDIRHTNTLLNTNKVDIDFIKGAGIGFLYPKTNATLLNNERYDDFNIAGYGISAVAAVRVTFFERFFIQSELKGGFINLPNIRTTLSSADSASQNFFFLQQNILFGGIFNLSKASKVKNRKK